MDSEQIHPLRHLHCLDLHIHVRGQVYGYLQQNALAAGGASKCLQETVAATASFLLIPESVSYAQAQALSQILILRRSLHPSTWQPQPPHLIAVFPQSDVAEVRNRFPQVHLWPANPRRWKIEGSQKRPF